jgi:RimJ/RimL family protein N-acetyltransferase
MIELHSFTRTDIEALIRWIDSPEFLMQWGGPRLSYPLDESQIGEILLQTAGSEPTALVFKAICSICQQSVGHIELSNIDRNNKSARVCRVLVGPKSLRGRGRGAEMLRAVLRIGFEQLSLHRIELVVFDFNESAIACYEKAGFQKEGRLRDCYRLGDRYLSLYMMSILAPQWSSTDSVGELERRPPQALDCGCN